MADTKIDTLLVTNAALSACTLLVEWVDSGNPDEVVLNDAVTFARMALRRNAALIEKNEAES
jgi:hypothetical protein